MKLDIQYEMQRAGGRGQRIQMLDTLQSLYLTNVIIHTGFELETLNFEL